MRRDSSGLSWRGPRPGPIASTVTEHRRFPGNSWPEWSPPSAMARRGCQWDSGCSASRTRIAAAGWRKYVAIEARNLAPLPGDVDFTAGASLPMPGLTAWQGLFDHGRRQAGQSVLVHGVAGSAGSMVTHLAREFGSYVGAAGRASDRQQAHHPRSAEFVG